MKNELLLDLQRFAEDGGDGQDGVQASTEESVEKSEPFKTFETESEMDSFFDKKLNKALETARSNWQKEQDEQAKTAKERKKMSEDERREYDFKQREQALTDREAEITKRENKSKLANQLIQDGLPVGLADVFDGVLADEKVMNESYQKVSEAFRGAVHDAVETRLARSARTPKSSQSTKTKSVGEMFAEKANNATQSKNDFWK